MPDVSISSDLKPLTPETNANGLQFEVECHDDVAAIARSLSEKLELDGESAKAFAVGLKLFAEIVLRNRQTEPFSQIRPALSEFNNTLKNLPKRTQE